MRPRWRTSELQAPEMRANVPIWARRGPSDGRPNCARLRPTQQSRFLRSARVRRLLCERGRLCRRRPSAPSSWRLGGRAGGDASLDGGWRRTSRLCRGAGGDLSSRDPGRLRSSATASRSGDLRPGRDLARGPRRTDRYPEHTIRTEIVSRMCGEAPVHHAVAYDDLERVDRGRYRLRAKSGPTRV